MAESRWADDESAAADEERRSCLRVVFGLLVWAPLASFFGAGVLKLVAEDASVRRVGPLVAGTVVLGWLLGSGLALRHALRSARVDNVWLPVLVVTLVIPPCSAFWNPFSWFPLVFWLLPVLVLPAYWLWNVRRPARRRQKLREVDSPPDSPEDAPHTPWDE